MLVYIVFLMILVGVTAALYQVYETHYNINFGNEKNLSKAEQGRLKELSHKAKNALNIKEYSDFDQAVADYLGAHFDRQVALAAFSEEKNGAGSAVLRRKARLNFKASQENINRSDIRVHHAPFLETKLPTLNIRGLLLTLVIANCFLAQLLGAISIYTINYGFSVDYLVWFNEPIIVMLLIYALIFITYGISKFDMYMHDLYQISSLVRHDAADESSQPHPCL